MDQLSLDDSPEQLRLSAAWENVVKRLSKEAPAGMMDKFIRKLHPVAFVDGSATLCASGRFVLEWVEKKFRARLTELLSDELGEVVELRLTVGPSLKIAEPNPLPAVAPVAIRQPSSSTRFQPNPRYTFDTFVVGQSNRLAVAGAAAIAKDPGGRLNPLFIYGASGLGKTHLLHAIANEVLARDPGYPVAYVTGQQFAEDFVNALQANRVEQFRRTHRGVGLWLVDDIQFIAGRDKTQEEFFHTFNYLQSLDKQLVFIADNAPRLLRVSEERLTSRFEAGLVADVQPPDTETRCAIILSKARQDAIDLDPEVAMYLAECVPGNIRVLEGALTRLATQASVLGMPMDMALAVLLIEQHYKQAKGVRPSFSQILCAVSKEFGIPIDDIKGSCRNAPIVEARHVAIFITREMTGDSWKHIGTLFGDRDHTSMMHGYNKISDLIQTKKDLRAQVRHLIRSLQPE